MFEDFVDKNVIAYLMSNPDDTYVIKGKLIKTNELSTTIEVEERKKFGEMKRYQRAINNRYITFIDLAIEPKNEEKENKEIKEVKEIKEIKIPEDVQ